MKRMPLLIDGDTAVPEATIIVEYLQLHHPGSKTMIPADRQTALEVRLLDRVADNYVMTPVQTIVADGMNGDTRRDPIAVNAARSMLDTAYGWWNVHMDGRTWAVADFGLADYACAAALFLPTGSIRFRTSIRRFATTEHVCSSNRVLPVR